MLKTPVAHPVQATRLLGQAEAIIFQTIRQAAMDVEVVWVVKNNKAAGAKNAVQLSG